MILIAGIAGGSMLGMRQMRRVAAIRRVTRQIAEGDLGKRLPVGRYDELDLLAHLVNHMLDEVERLMGEVRHTCDGIAHDLRTPLARVHTMLARLAEQPFCADDPASSALLASARDETDRLLERFRAMLRISEIGTLSRRGGFAAVDVTALLRDVCGFYEPLAEAVDVSFELAATSVDRIHGDRALLFEAFSNLADNAIKFTPPGGHVRVALHSTPSGPLVRIEDTARHPARRTRRGARAFLSRRAHAPCERLGAWAEHRLGGDARARLCAADRRCAAGRCGDHGRMLAALARMTASGNDRCASC